MKPIKVINIKIRERTALLTCRFADVKVRRSIMIPDTLVDRDMLEGMVESNPELLLAWVTSECRIQYVWSPPMFGPGLMEFLKGANTIPYTPVAGHIDYTTKAIKALWKNTI